MTTRVEELRETVMRECGVDTPWYGDPNAMAVDALITAARQEGAEAERERIRAGSEQFSEGDFVEDSDYIGIRYGVHSDNAVADADIYVVPASVLAPAPKEKEK
jgi:hypothetical protein